MLRQCRLGNRSFDHWELLGTNGVSADLSWTQRTEQRYVRRWDRCSISQQPFQYHLQARQRIAAISYWPRFSDRVQCRMGNIEQHWRWWTVCRRPLSHCTTETGMYDKYCFSSHWIVASYGRTANRPRVILFISLESTVSFIMNLHFYFSFLVALSLQDQPETPQEELTNPTTMTNDKTTQEFLEYSLLFQTFKWSFH